MQERDYRWFLCHYAEIYKQYGTSYVVVRNQQVVSTHRSFAEGVQYAQRRWKPGTYIVQYCNGDESGYVGSIASTHFMDD